MPFPYIPEFLDGAFTYESYRQHINELVNTLSTDEASLKMLPYISANIALMNKYDESYRLSEELVSIVEQSSPVTWLVITEGWCGDAAFNLPLLALVEKQFPEKVRLRLFLRDSNPELIDANLTDGGRSIPKLVILDQDMKELGSWGPRPAGLQTLMNQWKEGGLILKDIIPKAKEWYNADDTRSIQEELIALIKTTPLVNKYS
jgi:hypothetical protein